MVCDAIKGRGAGVSIESSMADFSGQYPVSPRCNKEPPIMILPKEIKGCENILVIPLNKMNAPVPNEIILSDLPTFASGLS